MGPIGLVTMNMDLIINNFGLATMYMDLITNNFDVERYISYMNLVFCKKKYI